MSKHLRALKQARLVDVEPRGQQRLYDVGTAIGMVAAITFSSGLVAAIRMKETLKMPTRSPSGTSSEQPCAEGCKPVAAASHESDLTR